MLFRRFDDYERTLAQLAEPGRGREHEPGRGREHEPGRGREHEPGRGGREREAGRERAPVG
jgi:hypothetical protein